MTRTTIRSLLAVVFFLPACIAASAQTATPVYSVEAIRCGTIKDFPVASLVAGADKTRHMDIAMVFWPVQGDGRNILVDSGFYRPQFFRDWKIADYQKPSAALRNAG